MLVLTRRTSETIRIGDDIVVKVIRKKGRSTVKIGIEAPPDVRVLRGELVERDILPIRDFAPRRPGARQVLVSARGE